MPQTDDAYFEVWLLAEDVSRMVSLGTMDGPSTSLPIPTGVNLADYPVVDVSIEPFDGDPTHSSDSLVRGTLSV
jgi:anti-sigma-K factor RskA